MQDDEAPELTDEERLQHRAAGAREASRDRALVRLDDEEIKQRMWDAFGRFVKEGFSVHLIGVRARSATEYRLALYPDGADAAGAENVQALADEYRLDFTIEKSDAIEGGWMIVLYPRW